MNNWNGIGRVTREPELKYMQGNGEAYLRFGIAVQRKFKNKAGKYDADFLNCVAYKGAAETIAKFFSKGSMIAITGEIRTGSYENKEGQKINTTEIIVGQFDFCGGSSQQQNNGHVNNQSDFDLGTPVDDGEIPF